MDCARCPLPQHPTVIPSCFSRRLFFNTGTASVTRLPPASQPRSRTPRTTRIPVRTTSTVSQYVVGVRLFCCSGQELRQKLETCISYPAPFKGRIISDLIKRWRRLSTSHTYPLEGATFKPATHEPTLSAAMSRVSWEPTLSADSVARYLGVTSSLSHGDMLILIYVSFLQIFDATIPRSFSEETMSIRNIALNSAQSSFASS